MSTTEISIKHFDPLTVSDELWEKYFDFYEKILTELFPNDPLPSREITKKSMINPDPNFENYECVIFSKDIEGKIIGFGNVSFNTEISPAYQANKHVAFGYISIDNKYRRLGIGTEFLKTLVVKAQEEGKKILYIDVLLDSGKNFCDGKGGVSVAEEEDSRLNIENVNWEMVNKWREEGAIRAKSVTIEKFEAVPEEDIEEYIRIRNETQNQIPLGEVEWKFEDSPKTRRERETHYKNLGATWITFISREKYRTISGLTETLYNPDRPTFLNQRLTGVKKEYRGRGLGKWLKAEMLTYVKEKFPEVKTIATDFAATNAPMIAINEKLGFRSITSWTTYKFQVEDLGKNLGL